MIWHHGRVTPEGALRVGVDDRVFEHGLGLFETLRTWEGVAPLLLRHMDRLRASAVDLGLSTEGVALPDDPAVAALSLAAGLGPDLMLRVTMTGGSASGRPPLAWMSARPLPAPEPRPIRVAIDLAGAGCEEASIGRHKSLNYWGRRLAYERARAMGLTETLLIGPDRQLWEGSRNNIVFVPAGAARVLVSPILKGPVIPGIMRRHALDFAVGLGYAIEERPVRVDELFGARAVFLTNSVRGVRRVDEIGGRSLDGSAEVDLTGRFEVELPRSIRGHVPTEMERS